MPYQESKYFIQKWILNHLLHQAATLRYFLPLTVTILYFWAFGSSACSVLRSFHLMLRRNLWKKWFELLKNNIAILNHCCEWTECTDEERRTNPATMRRKSCIHFFLQCGNRFREEDTGVCAKSALNGKGGCCRWRSVGLWQLYAPSPPLSTFCEPSTLWSSRDPRLWSLQCKERVNYGCFLSLFHNHSLNHTNTHLAACTHTRYNPGSRGFPVCRTGSCNWALRRCRAHFCWEPEQSGRDLRNVATYHLVMCSHQT